MAVRKRTIYAVLPTSRDAVRMPLDGYDVGLGMGVVDMHDPRLEGPAERARRTKTHQWQLVDIATGMRVSGTPHPTRREAIDEWTPEARARVLEFRGTERYRALKAEADADVTSICEDAERWSHPESEPSVDAEPVEVVEEVPTEAYADVDAGREHEPEPDRGPHAETRPERFRREYADAYEMLHDHDGDETVAALERSLMLAGEAFMRDHPRMLGKFMKWRGDMFSSDREVAALGMVALAWMDAGRQDRAAA